MSPPCGSSRNDTDNDANHALSSERSKRGAMLKSQSTKRRLAVSAESDAPKGAQEYKPRVIEKNFEARERLEHALAKNYLFKFLDKEQTKIVIDSVQEIKFNLGDIIIKQGDPGNIFYLLEMNRVFDFDTIMPIVCKDLHACWRDLKESIFDIDGECEVWISQPGKSDQEMVKRYTAGDSFGELALLYNAPRAATVKAVTRSVLWGMDRTTFRAILMHTTNEKRQLYENFLQEVPLLKTLNKYERSAIADVLQGQYFEKGQDIIVEGQCGDKLYFLEEGEADAKAGQKLTMKYRRGDYFGELALLHDQPRAATVTAVTQCKCVTIDRESFKRLLGKLEDILVRKEEMYAAGQSVESN